MTTATRAVPVKAPPRYQNFAEVLEAVGHVPDYRLRVRPAPGEATEDDILAIQAEEGRLCELIDGILVEKDMATWESRVAFILAVALENFQRGKKLGTVLPGDGFLRLFPGRVRAPDVSFIPKKNMPRRKFPRQRIASLVPDLAVEVLSEGNTEAEMNLKLQEYFRAGTRLVWIVDPKTRTVRVYHSPRKFALLTENQSVDGGKVLPGFSLSIHDWFEEAGEVEE